MKKLPAIALLLVALSSVGHFYLAQRAYQLDAGTASASAICNIGGHFNCDSALLSPYAKLFGASLSVFGLGFNLALSGLLISFLLSGAGAYWKNMSFYVAGGLALSSLAMAIISLANHLFCPVCWGLYLLSFLILGLLFLAFKDDLIKPLSFALKIAKQKNFYILAGSAVFISLFFHIRFITAFDLKNQKQDLEVLLHDWRLADTVKIEADPILQKGVADSNMLIVEFADFLCPACKTAQIALRRFLSYFPDVSFQFYVYPLDGVCNPSINIKRSGLTCKLSQALICADRQGKGWLLHDLIFERQNSFLDLQGNKKKSEILLNKLIVQSHLDKERLAGCMTDPDVLLKIQQSAQAGKQARIPGTPSFFVNGKPLEYSSKLLILKRIYDHLKKGRE